MLQMAVSFEHLGNNRTRLGSENFHEVEEVSERHRRLLLLLGAALAFVGVLGDVLLLLFLDRNGVRLQLLFDVGQL